MTEITDSQNLHHVTLSVPDIGCDHCVQTIETKLKSLDGITKVSASVEAKTVDLDFDEGVISLGKIESALDEEGYPVAR